MRACELLLASPDCEHGGSVYQPTDGLAPLLRHTLVYGVMPSTNKCVNRDIL